MGEHEKCPKCGRRLSMDRGGYSRANVKSGFGFQLPTSLNCINCGYYKEVFQEKEVNVEFKKGSATNDYPLTRKSLGDPGWLGNRIAQHYDKIGMLRMSGKSWKQIHEELIKEDPIFKKALKKSITNVFMRQLKSRGNHERV